MADGNYRTVIDHKLWQSTQELEKLESELRRR